MSLLKSKAAILGLGTVQWGMHYGVANTHGMLSAADVKLILQRATTYDISFLDTAPAYGNSEDLIGRSGLHDFKIVTKTPSFKSLAITKEQVSLLRSSFSRSCERMGYQKVYGLLAHHAEDLLVPNGDHLMHAMLQLKEEGLVEKIGASVYESGQIDALLARYPLDLVQLPINVLDQRLIHNGTLGKLKAQDVEIHARSIFLQGLLVMSSADINSYFKPIESLMRRFDDAATAQGMSKTQAAMAFVRDIPEVDAMMVGVDNLSQLKQCFEIYKQSAKFDASGLACHDPDYVNPARWRLA